MIQTKQFQTKVVGESLMPRMNSRTMLFCHMELKWNDKDPDPCRDEVQNNAHSIMKHMITKHFWKVIPELARKECENQKDIDAKIKLYVHTPEEWFIDNQLIWSEFRNFHFKKTLEVSGQ